MAGRPKLFNHGIQVFRVDRLRKNLIDAARPQRAGLRDRHVFGGQCDEYRGLFVGPDKRIDSRELDRIVRIGFEDDDVVL